MLVCPTDNILITIEKKHQDMVNGLYVDTMHHPEDHVTITGKVVSLPKSITNRIDYKGYVTAGILPGDTVIFRYDVVFHYSKQVENEAFTHKYELFYKGQSFWKLNIVKCFAYIRDGQINMVNGYVMLEEPKEEPTNLYVPHYLVSLPRTTCATVMHIGTPLEYVKPISVSPDDTVYFDSKIAQHYQINGKKFIILKQSHILGKEEGINTVLRAV